MVRLSILLLTWKLMRVGVAAAHALVQRADGVVELVAALVVAAQPLAQRRQQPGFVHLRAALRAGGNGERLQGVEQPARVAVGIGHQALPRRGGQGRDLAGLLRAVDQRLQVGFRQRLQHIHRGARQQRGIDLEARILGGGADEGEQAAFHVRQEGVLLRLVEAVHLVDENERRLGMQPVARGLGALHRVADILDAAQHRADGDELGVERLRHQARQRRLAHARRAP